MRRCLMSSDFEVREISLRHLPSPFIPLAYHRSRSREQIGMLEPQITEAGVWPRRIRHVASSRRIDPVFESMSASR
jgi:hypothetical protein